MKKILTFILLAVLSFCAVFACVSCRATAVTDKVTAFSASALTSAGNPYEDPNDPNTKPGEGTCISTDTVTGYFMEIKLTKQTTGIVDPKYEPDCAKYWGGTAVWSDVYHDCTAILTFVDLKYHGHPVFVSVFTKAYYEVKSIFHHARMWFQEDFTEAKDNAIRIPKTYYDFIRWEQAEKGVSLNRFNVTFLKNNGKDVIGLKYTQEVEVRLYSKEVSADNDDPASPNFKLDNWTGIMSAAAKGKAGCDSFVSWLENNWVYVVIGAAVIIFIAVVIRIIRGKK